MGKYPGQRWVDDKGSGQRVRRTGKSSSSMAGTNRAKPKKDIVFDPEYLEDGQGIDDGDYTKTPSGSLGSKVSVGRQNEGYLGEFDDEDVADAAIREDAKRRRIWPAVWQVSDHGNINAEKFNYGPGP